MNIQVLTHGVSIPLAQDFDRVKSYLAAHGVDAKFVFTKIKFSNYRTKQVRLPFGGYRTFLDYDESIIVRNIDSMADITIFAFDGGKFKLRDMPTSNAYTASSGHVIINLLTYNSVVKDELYLTIIHEMMHAFFKYLLSRRSIVLEDPMDAMIVGGKIVPYYNNDQPDSPDSNFGEAWRRLAPYIGTQKPTDGVVVINRSSESTKQTIGTLTAMNGGATFTCRSLELPWLDNKKNISCIPVGTYECKWTYSLKYPLGTYEILKVPNRGGIRFHSGNYATGKQVDVEGCIMLGSGMADINNDKELDITNSRVTVDLFNKFMQKKPFVLQIK